MKRLAFSLLLAGGLAFAWEEGDEGKCPAKGLYENAYYGFSVVIPDGLRGCPNSPTFTPDHGVIVPLAGDEPRTIEAYAGFNAVLFASAKEAAQNSVEWIEERAVPGSVTIERSATTLAGLKAFRFVARFRESASKKDMVHEVVCSLRPVRRGEDVPSHEYLVSLKTTAEHYPADRRLFLRLLRSWKATTVGL